MNEHAVSAERLRAAKGHAKILLADLEGFRGVGVGDGTVRVYVRDAAAGAELPDEVDGVPVERVVVDEITTY